MCTFEMHCFKHPFYAGVPEWQDIKMLSTVVLYLSYISQTIYIQSFHLSTYKQAFTCTTHLILLKDLRHC